MGGTNGPLVRSMDLKPGNLKVVPFELLALGGKH